MSTKDYSTDSFNAAFTSFNELVVATVAKRIATLAQTDVVAAKADYDQHIGAMSADEAAYFNHLIGCYAAVIE